MEAIAAKDIRTASLHFPTIASASPDGWHPRRYNIIEREGDLPNQMDVILTVLLAKPLGGFRLIALLPPLYRLWMKIGKPFCEQSELKWQRSFCAMAEVEAPADTVWRSAIKKEAALGDGKEAVTLLWT